MKPNTLRRQRGVTIVELMISMLLGLVIIGGATAVILSNRQSYRTNEGLSQVQESARTAFELLSRDVREAGITGCTNNNRMVNVLDPTGTLLWWQTWFGIAGFDGNQATPAAPFAALAPGRVESTDALLVQGIVGTGLTVEDHDPVSANLKINAETTDFIERDILIVCDFDHSAMFQVTNYNDGNVTVVHSRKEGGQTVVPGNCTKGLGYPRVCDTNGTPYSFKPNSQVARLSASAWYIGNNGRAGEGGRSLYRVRLGRGAVPITEEVVAGVIDMQVQYREQGGGVDTFRTASTVGNWSNVNAVRVTLTLQSAERRVSTNLDEDAGRLERTFSHIVTLRNRVP
jgi:type IV pilus assembly protein PilW